MRLLLIILFLLSFPTNEIYSQQTEYFSQTEKVAEITFENPILGLDASLYDFGKVETGEIVTHIYKFKNSGEFPLTILYAKASCGCTTIPYFSKSPIMPGESSEIKVVFDTKGKKGKHSKRITIYANTYPRYTFLTIRGEITLAEADSVSEDVNVIDTSLENQEKEVLKPNCFAIYPNPTSEILQLELKEHFGKSSLVEIHNETGQKVITKNIDSISNETTRFDVSNLAAGHYYISIFLGNSKPITQCFVILNK